MNLQPFSVILHSPTTPCPSVCLQCILCLLLLDLSIIKMLFSLSVSSPFLTAFHVTTVSRWTAPLAPNAKSGTSAFFIFFLIGLSCSLYLGSWLVRVSVLPEQVLICTNVLYRLSLQEESLDLSLSCQTVWTQQDRKVRLGSSGSGNFQVGFLVVKYVSLSNDNFLLLISWKISWQIKQLIFQLNLLINFFGYKLSRLSAGKSINVSLPCCPMICN